MRWQGPQGATEGVDVRSMTYVAPAAERRQRAKFLRSFKAVLAEFVMQSSPCDAQLPGRFALVVACLA